MNRRFVVWLFLLAGASGLGLRSFAAPSPSGLQVRRDDDRASSRILKLRSWATAVREHEPGEFDPPAFFINDWAPADLKAVANDLRTLLKGLAAASKAPSRYLAGELKFEVAGRQFTLAGLRDLLGLTDEEVGRYHANDLLERGALLHADIAMLAPQDTRTASDSPVGLSVMVFLYRDGRLEGVALSGAHWEIGRVLLGEVRPDPALDETVRLWYGATSAYLQTHHAFVYADPHLEQARRFFPNDAEILMYSGSMHETYATPGLQATVGPSAESPSRESGTGTATVVGSIPAGGTRRESYASPIRSAREELQRAESFFRQALKNRPELTEARIRLGRVLEQLEHHQEAAAELRQAMAGTNKELLLYYASLFLGQAEQALGHRESARDAFQRAAALYPRAQSPRLALSQLARRYGDRSAALGAIQEVLALPSDEERREDPWWRYHDTHVPDADALLKALREQFQREKPR